MFTAEDALAAADAINERGMASAGETRAIVSEGDLDLGQYSTAQLQAVLRAECSGLDITRETLLEVIERSPIPDKPYVGAAAFFYLLVGLQMAKTRQETE